MASLSRGRNWAITIRGHFSADPVRRGQSWLRDAENRSDADRGVNTHCVPFLRAVKRLMSFCAVETCGKKRIAHDQPSQFRCRLHWLRRERAR